TLAALLLQDSSLLAVSLPQQLQVNAADVADGTDGKGHQLLKSGRQWYGCPFFDLTLAKRPRLYEDDLSWVSPIAFSVLLVYERVSFGQQAALGVDIDVMHDLRKKLVRPTLRVHQVLDHAVEILFLLVP